MLENKGSSSNSTFLEAKFVHCVDKQGGFTFDGRVILVGGFKSHSVVLVYKSLICKLPRVFEQIGKQV